MRYQIEMNMKHLENILWMMNMKTLLSYTWKQQQSAYHPDHEANKKFYWSLELLAIMWYIL